MEHHIYSAEQTCPTSDVCVDPLMSKAIADADRLSEKKGCDMTVVRTFDDKICILDYFEMKVLKNEIAEKIYSAYDGFIFNAKQ